MVTSLLLGSSNAGLHGIFTLARAVASVAKFLYCRMRGETVFGSITRAGVTAVWSLLLPLRSDSEMEGCGVPSSDVSVVSVRMMRASVAAATAIDARIWSFVIATMLLCIRYVFELGSNIR